MKIPEIGLWAAPGDMRSLAVDARILEGLGIRSIWTGEHNDAIVTAGALAVSTSSAIIGTSIAQLSRTPAQMALSCIALQTLTGGRFRLGLGMGGRQSWQGWHGLPWERRSQRFAEYVHAVRSLSKASPGTPVTFTGEFYSVDGFGLIGGHEAPPTPIWVAAAGPKMFETAGAVGDGVFVINLMPPSYFRDVAAGRIAKSARAAGRDPSTIVTSFVRYTAVSDDRAVARDLLRRTLARSAAADYHQEILSASGFAADAAGVKAAAGDLDAAAAAISDDLIDTVGFAGTPSDLRDQVARAGEYADAVMIHTCGTGLTAEETNAHNRAIAEALASLID